MRYTSVQSTGGIHPHPTGDPGLVARAASAAGDRADRRATLAGYYVAGLLLLAAGWLFWLGYQDFAMAQRVTTQTLGAAADLEHVAAAEPVVFAGRIGRPDGVAGRPPRVDDVRRLETEPKNTCGGPWRVCAPPFALTVTDGSVSIANKGYALVICPRETGPGGATRRGLRRGDAVVVVGSVVDGGVAADTVVGGRPAAYSSALRGEGLLSLLLGLGVLALAVVVGGLGAGLWRRRWAGSIPGVSFMAHTTYIGFR